MNILICGSRIYGRARDVYTSEEERIEDLKNRVEPQKQKFSNTMAQIISERTGGIEYDFHGYVIVQGVTIISGMAKGADTLAVNFAKFFGIPLLEFPADWNRYKNGAGPIRNQQMIDEGKPNLVIAFPFEKSTGTWDMINRSRFEDIEVIVVEDI